MLKDSEVKKIIKNFNKCGKGLRPDGLYAIKNNRIYSTIENQLHGTPGGFCIRFLDKNIEKGFNLLCTNELINGVDLNKVVTGTGVKVELDDNDILMKLENNELVFEPIHYTKIKNQLISGYHKYNHYIENNVEYETELPRELIDEMIKQKTFIMDICEYIDIPDRIFSLKVSNKVLKNFSKTTQSIRVQVSKSYEEFRVVKYILRDELCETESIYALIIE